MWVQVALLFAVLEVVFEGYLSFRQLFHVRRVNSPPDYFKDVDPKEFAQSKNYLLEKTRFGLIALAYGLIPGIIGILLTHYLWTATAWFSSEMAHSWIYVLIQNVIETLITLPLAYYRKFVIEEKYGFNKSTLRLWVTDTIKDFLVDSVVTLIFMTAVILVFRYLGDLFIVVSLALLFILTVILQVLYPPLILPLFTKLTPLEEGEVRTAVMELAKATDFNMAEVYVSDDSKRTSKQNAMMFGFFKHKIAIADTVLQTSSCDDICAIIAHEIGHSKHHHIFRMMLVQQILFGLVLFLIDRIMKSAEIFAAFGFTDERPLIIGVIIIQYLAVPLFKCLQLPANILLRSMEYQADAFAANRNMKLEEALIKLHGDNKAMIDPDPLYSAFKDSHPTLYQRVIAIRKIQSKLK